MAAQVRPDAERTGRIGYAKKFGQPASQNLCCPKISRVTILRLGSQLWRRQRVGLLRLGDRFGRLLRRFRRLRRVFFARIGHRSTSCVRPRPAEPKANCLGERRCLKNEHDLRSGTPTVGFPAGAMHKKLAWNARKTCCLENEQPHFGRIALLSGCGDLLAILRHLRNDPTYHFPLTL